VLLFVCVGLWGATAALALGPGERGARQKLFVIAKHGIHKRALMASASSTSLRMELGGPGNAQTFSGEFTSEEIEALSQLGARFEPVEEIFPLVRRERVGHLRGGERSAKIHKGGKPSCGDGTCRGRENATTCPLDCDGGRACRPQDQEEYQTLLSNGEVPLSAGAGVRLFVIDTGTTPSHPDLRVSVCRDVTGRKVKHGCADTDGHGTHTSGSAAANAGRDGLGLIGGAPGATLGVIKICDGLCFTDALVRGIEEAVKRRADIISLSFAASDSEPLRNAVAHAVERGVLFLAAAGNAGPLPNSIVYPAAYPGVVAVGMLDPSRIVSPFSSRGVDDGEDGVVGSRELELAAGGFLVESTWTDGCYRVLSGTSMSTPAVAGLAAAHWQGDAAATRAWLVEMAEDVDNSSRAPGVDPSSQGWDAASGYGLARAGAGSSGGGAASVTSIPSAGFYAEEILLDVNGPAHAVYRIGVTSPSGDWAWGQFTTDSAGRGEVRLNPWRDPGVWLVSLDVGGGPYGFDADWATYRQH